MIVILDKDSYDASEKEVLFLCSEVRELMILYDTKQVKKRIMKYSTLVPQDFYFYYWLWFYLFIIFYGLVQE